jgi:D-erythro-7,8-dihydroneopterin triphosphate epimerase
MGERAPLPVTISIKNLRLQVVLGVNPRERTTVRDVVVNLKAEYDARPAVVSDSLADALDYSQIRDRILAVTRDTSFHLLESLAACIGDELRREPRLRKLHLEVDKPGALRLADSVSITASWERETAL